LETNPVAPYAAIVELLVAGLAQWVRIFGGNILKVEKKV
jgi:hypothetical protein